MAEDKKETKKKAPAKKTTAKKSAPKKTETKAAAKKTDAKANAKKKAPAKKASTKTKTAAKKKPAGKVIKITQIGSAIGRQSIQRKTLIGLGLNKMYKTRELEDTPAIRGMIRKVSHLVRIEDAA